MEKCAENDSRGSEVREKKNAGISNEDAFFYFVCGWD